MPKTDDKTDRALAKAKQQAARAAELAKLQQVSARPKKLGRPRTVEPLDSETEQAILQHVASGMTLLAVCRLEGAPDYHRVVAHASRSNSFAKALARAREIGAGAMADEIIEIAEERAADSAAVQRNRLRIEARARVAGWYNQHYRDGMRPDDVAGVVAATIEAARARYQAKHKRKGLAAEKAIESEKVEKSGT